MYIALGFPFLVSGLLVIIEELLKQIFIENLPVPGIVLGTKDTGLDKKKEILSLIKFTF